MRKGKIFIGTSGWSYKHWKGNFYPEGLKETDQFAHYRKSFKTVELNNSFYRLPPAQTFANWYRSTPKGFLFAVKASRFFTHMKKLIVDHDSIVRFFSQVGELREKLGPILFQLPPRWKVNPDRLETFLKALPKGNRYTFEFREPTWYDERIYALLREFGCSFCIYELDYHQSPLVVTADFVYVRLHGPGGKYQGSYSDDVLMHWSEKCRAWGNEGKDVYVYFDNDQEGYAAFNAQTMLRLTGGTKGGR